MLSLLVFTISLFFLVKSADYFVESAEKIGIRLRLPHFFIGTVLIGLGTSLPELTTSLISVFENQYSIPVANVVGSNIANILLITGIASLITPLIVKQKLIKVELPFLFLSSFLLLLFSFNYQIKPFEGLVLLFSFIAYLLYIIKQDKKEENKKIKVNLALEGLKLIVSLAILVVSSKYAVDSLIQLSKSLGIAVDLLSAILLAIGTSLPELMASISVIRKGKSHDMILGNVIGSNIINVFLILGLPSLFHPLAVSKTMLLSALFLLFTTILFIFVLLDQKVDREEGVIFLILYTIYALYLFKPSLF